MKPPIQLLAVALVVLATGCKDAREQAKEKEEKSVEKEPEIGKETTENAESKEQEKSDNGDAVKVEDVGKKIVDDEAAQENDGKTTEAVPVETKEEPKEQAKCADENAMKNEEADSKGADGEAVQDQSAEDPKE